MRVLIADDEKLITTSLADSIRDAGYDVQVCGDGQDAVNVLKSHDYHVIISDVRMPKIDGKTLFGYVKQLQPNAKVIFITGFGTVEDAVQLIKEGAHDYIPKPFLNEHVIAKLKALDDFFSMREENRALRDRLAGTDRVGDIVGRSKPMRTVFQLIESVAKSDCNVLIEGESGTGKTLAARAIHLQSPRRRQSFVDISCSVIPETLIESELFGHVKGAFTDARSDKLGRFEQANKGTIFIDDVDDLPKAMQVKLLRVLQERTFERVGEAKTVATDVRVIAATKRDLRGMVREGAFREDLYFRLDVVKLQLPALRERIEDIPMLVEHFIRKYGHNEKYTVTPELLQALQAYEWPGNVRELENAVERAIVLASSDKVLKHEHALMQFQSQPKGQLLAGPMAPLEDVVAQAESEHIKRVLQLVEGHRSKAAQVLGIPRKELWMKMKKYDIQ